MKLLQLQQKSDNDGRIILYIERRGDVSPRVGRKLKLRSNEYYHRHWTQEEYTRIGENQLSLPGLFNYGPAPLSDPDLENMVYAKFIKTMRESNAALGVSLASWRSSKDMIQGRLQQASKFLSGITTKKDARKLEKASQMTRGGSLPHKAAGTHLEFIFGWQPLFSDVASAMEVLCSDPPPSFVSARRNQTIKYREIIPGQPDFVQYIDRVYKRKLTYSGKVSVSNPNTYLLNQLGLLNPLPTAWDVIPWSFIVGMFANVGNWLSSPTDFVGIELSECSITRSTVGTNDWWKRFNPDYYPQLRNEFAHAQFRMVQKERSLVGSFPRPTLRLKVPPMSWGTLTMATSLAIQQSSRVLKLLR